MTSSKATLLLAHIEHHCWPNCLAAL